jgi:tetratricopeptide (TPR) repeat protein
MITAKPRSEISDKEKLEVPPIETPKQRGAEGQTVSYDEDLLRRAWMQWQFGEWKSLAMLESDALQDHPDRAVLALLSAAGRQQLDDASAVQQFVRLAEDWGCDKKLVIQVLIAGVHNILGRASAIIGQEQRARRHFENAIRSALPTSDVRLITQARVQQQLDQIRLVYSVSSSNQSPAFEGSNASHSVFDHFLSIADALEKVDCLDEADSILLKASKFQPKNAKLLAALAEMAMKRGDFAEAVRRWQDLVALLGETTPVEYYNRLNDSYVNLKSFPVGTIEEEAIRGDRDKYDLLSLVHKELEPRLYFEIGVQTGRSLLLASCKAIGIDPMPNVREPLPASTRVITTTSDTFFKGMANQILDEVPDLVFIDGMHFFEYALRDFMNMERRAIHSTLVVIDDIYPGHPAQAERRRRTRAWTGDVWKLREVLRTYRPDLFMLSINSAPTGLLFITSLDPTNNELWKNYESIVRGYMEIEQVPSSVINRINAISPNDDVILRILRIIKRVRQEDHSHERLNELLKTITIN